MVGIIVCVLLEEDKIIASLRITIFPAKIYADNFLVSVKRRIPLLTVLTGG